MLYETNGCLMLSRLFPKALHIMSTNPFLPCETQSPVAPLTEADAWRQIPSWDPVKCKEELVSLRSMGSSVSCEQ